MIVNQGGIDLIKTQHMVNFVSENSTVNMRISFNLLSAIPRSIWRISLLMWTLNLGWLFAFKLYGAGAVPRGAYWEIFWDFSWLGLLVASLITGFLMGFLDKMFHNNQESIFISIVFFLINLERNVHYGKLVLFLFCRPLFNLPYF